MLCIFHAFHEKGAAALFLSATAPFLLVVMTLCCWLYPTFTRKRDTDPDAAEKMLTGRNREFKTGKAADRSFAENSISYLRRRLVYRRKQVII